MCDARCAVVSGHSRCVAAAWRAVAPRLSHEPTHAAESLMMRLSSTTFKVSANIPEYQIDRTTRNCHIAVPHSKCVLGSLLSRERLCGCVGPAPMSRRHNVCAWLRLHIFQSRQPRALLRCALSCGGACVRACTVACSCFGRAACGNDVCRSDALCRAPPWWMARALYRCSPCKGARACCVWQ